MYSRRKYVSPGRRVITGQVVSEGGREGGREGKFVSKNENK
jgi:hypothetical protein